MDALAIRPVESRPIYIAGVSVLNRAWQIDSEGTASGLTRTDLDISVVRFYYAAGDGQPKAQMV
jgi:hypothetical protein